MGTHRRPKFYMSDRVEVFVCGGTGLVGSALVTQLRANAASRANIKLVGFCSSTKIIACEGEQKESVVRESADRRVPSDDEIMQCCSSPNATVCVVDATSSEDVSALYAPWLERRWHVVTCNKKVNSGNLEYYTRCMDATKNGGGKWFVEATIGAGLPIVSTLRTLVATGDEIESVQGIFSGTMSFLFNTWDGDGSGRGERFEERMRSSLRRSRRRQGALGISSSRGIRQGASLATLSGADNIFEIKTARYGPTGGSTPLIVRGPGAGAAVTAAGVFGDIVGLQRICRSRRARVGLA